MNKRHVYYISRTCSKAQKITRSRSNPSRPLFRVVRYTFLGAFLVCDEILATNGGVFEQRQRFSRRDTHGPRIRNVAAISSFRQLRKMHVSGKFDDNRSIFLASSSTRYYLKRKTCLIFTKYSSIRSVVFNLSWFTILISNIFITRKLFNRDRIFR